MSRCQSQSACNLKSGALALTFSESSLHVKSRVEQGFFPINLDEEFGTAEIMAIGQGFGDSVRFGQKADPLPVDPSSVAIDHKVLLIAGLEAPLEYLGDSLMRFQVTNPDSFLKIQKFGLETIQTHRRNRSTLHYSGQRAESPETPSSP